MNTLGLAILAQISIAASGSGAGTYSDAHRQTLQEGCPMVIMVGADWCPACQTMERFVLPEIQRRGILRRVAFAIVNVDRERELSQALTSGGPIPQLLMYRRTSAGWRLRRLIGGQSVETVESFIDEGVRLNDDEKLAQQKASQPKQPPHEQGASSTPARQASLSIQSTRP